MRTIHHRVYGVPSDRIDDLAQRADDLVSRRAWRGDRLWIATPLTRDLFESEYFRHARDEEGDSLSAAGFVRLDRDETDALATIYILATLSSEFECRAAYRDSAHALAKLRYLEFRRGRLPSGRPLDDMVGSRPVIKKVGEVAVTFYPPRYWSVVHPRTQEMPEEERPSGWAYAVHGLRAHAPTFLEAEREAMKLVNGFNRLQ